MIGSTTRIAKATLFYVKNIFEMHHDAYQRVRLDLKIPHNFFLKNLQTVSLKFWQLKNKFLGRRGPLINILQILMKLALHILMWQWYVPSFGSKGIIGSIFYK
jgi:hypothetical protein